MINISSQGRKGQGVVAEAVSKMHQRFLRLLGAQSSSRCESPATERHLAPFGSDYDGVYQNMLPRVAPKGTHGETQ